MPLTLKENATDVRAIVTNILAFIEENTGEALALANDGQPLPEFATVYNSAARGIVTNWPSLVVTRRRWEKATGNNVQGIRYTISFELMIVGPDPTQLSKDSDVYAFATESMLINMPDAVLLANVSNDARVRIEVTEVVFDEIGRGRSGYGQKLTVTARIILLEATNAR